MPYFKTFYAFFMGAMGAPYPESAERTYTIDAAGLTYTIAAEDRTYTVEAAP